MRLLFLATVALFSTACSSKPSGPFVPSGGADAGSSADTTSGDRCVDPGGDCSKGESCCNGAVCVSDVNAPSKGTCAATCLDNTQCKSGCCDTLKSGTAAVCSPAEYCAPTCAGAGDLCSLSACCAGTVCVTSTVDGTRCAATCKAHAECKSGCCAPLDNTGQLVCSPPNFCGR